MKVFMFSLLFASFNIFSSEIVLDRDSIVLDSNTVTLTKLSSSPNFINLTVPVPTEVKTCVESTSKQVYGRNGEACGYTVDVREFCTIDPHMGGLGININLGSGAITPNPAAARRCEYQMVDVPNSCYYTKTTCTKYEKETVIVDRNFKLQFENFNKDAEIEFSLSSKNKVTLKVKDMPYSCYKNVIYGKKEKTGAKIQIKRKCR